MGERPASIQGLYDDEFYDTYRIASRNSASKIVPIVLKLLSPCSVVDIGCGLGTWLSVFRENGVQDIVGLDGEFVNQERLLIPRDRFIPHDLSLPIRLGRTFDLVISMEVAEHLPEGFAAGFIESLTQLGKAILFSAAIPYQGGTGHVNEQWPEYWAALFAQHNYRALDCIRPAVWDDPSVASYYAQNSFVYVSDELLAQSAHLQSLVSPAEGLARVHPRMWLALIQEMQNAPCMMTPRELLGEFPASLRRSLKWRLGRLISR